MTRDDELPEPKRDEWNVDALWSRVRARTVDAAGDRARRVEPPVAAPGFPHRLGRYAAAASLLIIAGAGALIVRARTHSGEPAPGLYRTSRGQYATIRLTDSSEVTLAPESRLTISARFADGERELSLGGEAIFSVRHDAARPFRVRAGNALVEDIGTRFDLRAYPGDAGVTVAVVEGSVRLGAARDDSAGASARAAHGIVLASGQVGTLDERGNASIARAARASGYLGWASGTLAFENRPLPEVLRTIARWHDLDIRAGDARLARRLVTAEFSRQSVREMIDALAIAMDATVERNGRVVTLRPR